MPRLAKPGQAQPRPAKPRNLQAFLASGHIVHGHLQLVLLRLRPHIEATCSEPTAELRRAPLLRAEATRSSPMIAATRLVLESWIGPGDRPSSRAACGRALPDVALSPTSLPAFIGLRNGSNSPEGAGASDSLYGQ